MEANRSRENRLSRGAVDRSVAQSVFRKHQQNMPVNISGIAADLGLKIYAKDLGAISGILKYDPNHGGESGYVIYVNDAHPANRQRFTAAHEIAHFVLHAKNKYEPSAATFKIEDDEFYRFLPGPDEWAANEMAAEILMPWNLIEALRQSGIDTLPDMARRLGVSRQALAIRLGIPFDQDWT